MDAEPTRPPFAHRARALAPALFAPFFGRLRPAAIRRVGVDAVIIVGLTLLAAVPRLVVLTEIPPGLHGDEAWTGIDARRVLNEGWIGPYVESALGQPTGPLYFAAPVIGIFGDTVFAVRLAMAMLGIITIPVAYLTFRVMFNRTVGVFAALFLAMGLWHLHYSRIGFMVISWPLMELLTLLFLFLGLKTKRWLFYGLAGLALGAGIYTYNAYPIFAVAVALFVVWLVGRELVGWRLQEQAGRPVARFAGQIGLMGVAAVVAALPMILYAVEPNQDLVSHHRSVSLLESEEWDSRGLGGQARLVFDRTQEFYISAYWDGEPDFVDAAGSKAMVDRISVFLLPIGAALLLLRWREPASIVVLLVVLLLPFTSVFSSGAMLRRTVGIAPFVGLLAALPLAFWWRRSSDFSLPWRNFSYASVAVIVALVGYLNFDFYFDEFADADLTRFTFAREIAAASEYMDGLPDDPYVYFYSDRWGFNYETRRFLASDVQGEDRSERFGQFTLASNHPGPVAYVFLDPYLDQIEEVERLHPGGLRTDFFGDDGALFFLGYYLPSTEGFAAEPAD